MERDEALRRLPPAHSLALRLREDGASRGLIASRLEVEPEAVGPLLLTATLQVYVSAAQGAGNAVLLERIPLESYVNRVYDIPGQSLNIWVLPGADPVNVQVQVFGRA